MGGLLIFGERPIRRQNAAGVILADPDGVPGNAKYLVRDRTLRWSLIPKREIRGEWLSSDSVDIRSVFLW